MLTNRIHFPLWLKAAFNSRAGEEESHKTLTWRGPTHSVTRDRLAAVPKSEQSGQAALPEQEAAAACDPAVCPRCILLFIKGSRKAAALLEITRLLVT